MILKDSDLDVVSSSVNSFLNRTSASSVTVKSEFIQAMNEFNHQPQLSNFIEPETTNFDHLKPSVLLPISKFNKIDSLDDEMNSNLKSTTLNQMDDKLLTNDLSIEQIDQMNNDLNSNQLKDQTIGHLLKNGKKDYEDDDKVHFDFLTASQIQKIVSDLFLISSFYFDSKNFIIFRNN